MKCRRFLIPLRWLTTHLLMSASSEHKRIAHNTVFLYFRMLIIMGVTLYTGRVVLSVLGIDDYGIYNLVGGVVILFSFLSAAMTTATQRYLCVSIGVGDKEDTQRLFTSAIIAHLLLIVILVAVAETLGLWFIKSQLRIPAERMGAALTVYQFSILAAVIAVYRIPFTSAILSYEKMSFYAYSGILEAVLKLLILFPLYYVDADKLVLYGALICVVNTVIASLEIWYTHTRLEAVRHRLHNFVIRKVREVFAYAGWSSFSALASIGSRQAMNFLVNIFFGVALNAAVGVMNQVASAGTMFISNVQSAVNPPLMKGFARGDAQDTRNLLFVASKFTCALYLVLITPLVFNIRQILGVWLADVPPLSDMFCAFILISLIPNAMGGSIWAVVQAGGRIKKYQMMVSVVQLLNIPCFYLILKARISAPYMVLFQLITNGVVVFIGARMCRRLLGVKMRTLVVRSVLPNVLVLAVAWSVIELLNLTGWIHFQSRWLTLVVGVIVDLAVVAACVWWLGMNRGNRKMITDFVRSKITKR